MYIIGAVDPLHLSEMPTKASRGTLNREGTTEVIGRHDQDIVTMNLEVENAKMRRLTDPHIEASPHMPSFRSWRPGQGSPPFSERRQIPSSRCSML